MLQLSKKTQKQCLTEISRQEPHLSHEKRLKAQYQTSEQCQNFWKGLFSASQLTMPRLTDHSVRWDVARKGLNRKTNET